MNYDQMIIEALVEKARRGGFFWGVIAGAVASNIWMRVL